jgi:ATP-binding cassette subfamily B (MDR/TAP) protein 1
MEMASITEADGTFERFEGEIKLSNVSFCYPNRADIKVLNNLTLTIPANKTLAFFGLSGCGKSTIIQLIQKFYDPTTGSIHLDGHDIKTIDASYLRNQMALVSQEPILFDATIRENIRLGRLDATDADIEEAARQANAHQFIMGLEDTYETNVGETGTHLSGGQKQKICIARALI